MNRNMVSRKTSIVIGVFILIIGIGIVGGLLWQAFRIEAGVERPFVPERRQSAERHYRSTLGRDMENDYPRTPRELMELYAITVEFLYGDFIALDSMFLRVIDFQRSLFTEELRGLVSNEQQFQNLQESRATLGDADASIRRAVIHEFTIDYVYERHALVEVSHRFMFQDDLNRLYFLTLGDDDRWRIASWALADENFNIVEY